MLKQLPLNKPIYFLLFFLLIGCSDEPEKIIEADDADVSTNNYTLLPKDEIDAFIMESLEQNGDFNWSMASDEMIWSALMYSDSTVTIGYQPAEEGDITGKMASIDIKTKPWLASKERIIEEAIAIMEAEKKSGIDAKTLDIISHDVLPFVEFKVTDLTLVASLRDHANVRYLEPSGYSMDAKDYLEEGRQASSSGCTNDPDYGIPTTDYSVVEPNAKVSWNYDLMNISKAWDHSTGSGITVGLIDTGTSPDQHQLNGGFNSGHSSGRFVEKHGFYVSSFWWWSSPDGPDDDCGHGTSMAGVIAAPRGTTGSSVGVAYNSNLIAIRGTGDVLIQGSKEQTGVADGLVFLGNRSDVKVISMSIGNVFSSSKVADAVRYAYGKGKLIFSAAGTSTSFTNWYGVIFPATMNETVAVTGVKEGTGYSRCNTCHSGDKVDFTAVMEKYGTDRHPLTLSMGGYTPSTVGGSSVATATVAGIAALVWSKNPSWTRDQVLNKLKQASDLYPARSDSYGWGNIDALAAVQ